MSEQSHPPVKIDPRFLQIHPSVFIADTARVIGQVTIGEGSSVWYSAVLRADTEPITIGRHCSIQDGAIFHVDPGMPCTIGDYVTVGHRAVVHAATVGDNVIVGIGSIILSGAKIGANSIIGAGAVVAEGREIPPNSLVLGVPGKVVREISAEQAERIRRGAEHYVGFAQQFKARFG